MAKRQIISNEIECRDPKAAEQSAVVPATNPFPGKAPKHPPYIWDYVSRSPLGSLWNLEGVPVLVLTKNVWKAVFIDKLPGRSAELSFYFFFALFPTLFAACSILGLAARSAPKIYDHLLVYLTIVVPSSALGIVVRTFNETTAASTTGKLTFGLIVALWSASVGFSSIRDCLNVVYRVKEYRPYWKAQLAAVGATFLLFTLVTLILTSLLGAEFLANLARRGIQYPSLGASAALALRIVGWFVATTLLSLLFAIIYYVGPAVKTRRWRWLTPGSAIGISGWLLASVGLRLYAGLFNGLTASYGSLGAVIILLTWFYLSGFMLLLGGEINSEIEASVEATRLASKCEVNSEVTTAQPPTAPFAGQ